MRNVFYQLTTTIKMSLAFISLLGTAGCKNPLSNPKFTFERPEIEGPACYFSDYINQDSNDKDLNNDGRVDLLDFEQCKMDQLRSMNGTAQAVRDVGKTVERSYQQLFGSSAIRIEVRRNSGKGVDKGEWWCLTAKMQDSEYKVSWQKCIDDDSQTGIREQMWILPRIPVNTTVTYEHNGTTGKTEYKDFAFNMVPVDSFTNWASGPQGAKLQCLGLGSDKTSLSDFKVGGTSPHKNSTIKLSAGLLIADCTNKNFRNVWLNIGNNLAGDEILNPQNRFSHLILADPKSNDLSNELAMNHHPLDALMIKPGLRYHPTSGGTEDESSAFLDFYLRDGPMGAEGGPHSMTIDIRKSQSDADVNKCPHQALWTQEKLKPNNVQDKDIRLSCLNTESQDERDKSGQDRSSWEGDDKKWTWASNKNTIFLSQCETVNSPTSLLQSCFKSDINNGNRNKLHLFSLGTARNAEGITLQILKPEDKNQVVTAVATGNNPPVKVAYKKDQQSEVGTQFAGTWTSAEAETADSDFQMQLFLQTNDNTLQTALESAGLVSENSGMPCLDLAKSQPKLVKVESDSDCGAPRYKFSGDSTIAMRQVSENQAIQYKYFDVRVCTTAVRPILGPITDCYDYVPPHLQRLLMAADILSYIPLLNLLTSPFMYAVVCNANEAATISPEACMGLTVGTTMDVLFSPFDFMAAGYLVKATKNLVLRHTIKTLAKQLQNSIPSIVAKNNQLTTIAKKLTTRYQVLEEIAENSGKNSKELKAALDDASKEMAELGQELGKAGQKLGKELSETGTKVSTLSTDIVGRNSKKAAKLGEALAKKVSVRLKSNLQIDSDYLKQYMTQTAKSLNTEIDSDQALKHMINLLELDKSITKEGLTNFAKEVGPDIAAFHIGLGVTLGTAK